MPASMTGITRDTPMGATLSARRRRVPCLGAGGAGRSSC